MPEWALCSKGRLPECIVAWTCFFLSASPHTAFCNERSPPVKFNDILDVFSRASSLYIYIWLIVNQMCSNKCIKLSNKDFFIFYPIDAPKNGYHINISGYRDLFLWRLEYQTFKWVILQKPKWIEYQCYMCRLSLTPIQGVYTIIQSFGWADTKATDQGGRTWQPFVGGKKFSSNAYLQFLRQMCCFCTNSQICKFNSVKYAIYTI